MLVLDGVRLLLPLAIGFGAGWLCPVSDAGSEIPARPAGWVFGVMWTVLYLLIGVAWIYAARLNPWYDLAFGVLTIVLAGWVYFYGCKDNARAALYILFLSMLIVLLIFTSMVLDGSRMALLLAPLLVWLLFAGMLNYTQVNM